MLVRILIKLCKWLNVSLLEHAHVQAGAGHNTYLSGEERIINEELMRILKHEPAMIFDVGANVGNYAALLRKRFTSAAIHCFEPVLSTFSTLEKNTALMNVHCHPLGLSSHEEDLTLYRARHDAEGSMASVYREGLADLFPFMGGVESAIECHFTTIDRFCGDNGISVIDFMKIDVEGHELQVLKGARELLGGNRVKVIQFEFNEFNIVSRTFMKDFYDVLPGFRFFRVMPAGKLRAMGAYSPLHEIFRYQNILCIHNGLLYEQR
jgi:FkbM family methyltransferase